MVEDLWQDGGVKNEVKDQRNKKYDFKNKAEASWIYLILDMRVYYLWDNASKMFQKVPTAQIQF